MADFLLTEHSQPKVTGSIQHPGATGTRQLRVYTNGVVNFAGTLFSVTRAMASRTQQGIMLCLCS